MQGLFNERDALKFFSKRNQCGCLKEMHARSRKDLLKTSFCYNCNEVYERKYLMHCSRCAIAHYCSRKCQVDHWPLHQWQCDSTVNPNR